MAMSTLCVEIAQNFGAENRISLSEESESVEDSENDSQMNSNFLDAVKMYTEQTGLVHMHLNSVGSEMYYQGSDKQVDLLTTLREGMEVVDDNQLGYGHLNSISSHENEDSCSSAPYLKYSLKSSTDWMQRLDPMDPFLKELMQFDDIDIDEVQSSGDEPQSENPETETEAEAETNLGSVDASEASSDKDLDDESDKPLKDVGEINLEQSPVTSLRNLVDRIPISFGQSPSLFDTEKQLEAIRKDAESKESSFYSLPIKKLCRPRKYSSTLEKILLNADVPIEDIVKDIQSGGSGHLYSAAPTPPKQKNYKLGTGANKHIEEIVLSDSDDEIDAVNETKVVSKDIVTVDENSHIMESRDATITDTKMVLEEDGYDLEEGEILEDESVLTNEKQTESGTLIEARDVDSLLEQFEETAANLQLPNTPEDSPEAAYSQQKKGVKLKKDLGKQYPVLKSHLLKSSLVTPPATPTPVAVNVAEIAKKITPIKRKTAILTEPLAMPAKKSRKRAPSSQPNSRPSSRSSSPMISRNIFEDAEIPYSSHELIIDHDYCQSYSQDDGSRDSFQENKKPPLDANPVSRNNCKITEFSKDKDRFARSLWERNSTEQCSSVQGLSEWDSPPQGPEISQTEKPVVTVKYFDKIPEYFASKMLFPASVDSSEMAKTKMESKELSTVDIQIKNLNNESDCKRRSHSRSCSRSCSCSRSRSRSPLNSSLCSRSSSPCSTCSDYNERSYRSRRGRDSYSRSRSRSYSRSRSRSFAKSHRYRHSYSRSRSRSWSRSPRQRYSRSRSRGRRRLYSHRRRHRYTYSRSRSRSPYRSRSRSPYRSRRKSYSRHRTKSPYSRPSRRIDEIAPERGQEKQWEDRRVVYCGRIDEGTTRAYLRERFSAFGEIEKVSVHFRDFGDNYAFITFKYKCDAIACIENSNRKTAMGQKEVESQLDFDALLKQAQKKKKC
uniref:Peroxisome proliferator-activated receptor gamma coactivator 1-alpha-like n=1 Tax=Saccoglossus kowalevskii TaxID=10224 RepID=A0ABM0M632_SACKO|nr:PREDICTED: peroxisome proliferator-activated receptor gamma coactivator 1-alpha-like [Saccoglossus kowalevskii]